jgi:hypothetical protein
MAFMTARSNLLEAQDGLDLVDNLRMGALFLVTFVPVMAGALVWPATRHAIRERMPANIQQADGAISPGVLPPEQISPPGNVPKPLEYTFPFDLDGKSGSPLWRMSSTRQAPGHRRNSR